MGNMDIYNSLREVPQEAKKTIPKGKLAGFTDINPMWRIKKLTELFGVCGFGWYTEITNRWIEKGPDGKEAAFIEINLYVKQDGEWSKPIVGIGGSSFVNFFNKKLETSDEAFKMAYTDAISVACKALGMAADVYYTKDRTKYNMGDVLQEQIVTEEQMATPSVEYATEEQIAKLNKYYSGKLDKLDDFLKKQGVKNIIYLPRAKAQAVITRIETELAKTKE